MEKYRELLMGYGVEYRRWDDANPDTLGQIFRKLPLDEILNVVPLVCKSWANVVRGPYCWQEIDIEDWSRYRRLESLDRMLLLLVSKSHGSLRKLCVYGLSSVTGLDLIAEKYKHPIGVECGSTYCDQPPPGPPRWEQPGVCAKSLENLRLPRSEISDAMVEQVAWRFSALTSLDVSYCTKIGAPALKAFGKNCKLLTHLKRNMHPWDVIDRTSQDDEAFAIASTMPKLKHLELAYLMITKDGVDKIVISCHDLELLDMRGCWNVKLQGKFFDRFPKLTVVGPLVVNPCTTSSKRDQFYYYPCSSDFMDWSFGDVEFNNCDIDIDIDVENDGELGLVFYNNLDVANVGDVWPESQMRLS